MFRVSVKFFCVILNLICIVILEIKCDNFLYNVMVVVLIYLLNNLKLVRFGLFVFIRCFFRNIYLWVIM